MSKEELEDFFVCEDPLSKLAYGQVIDAMVAAYNRAIEDAVKLADWEIPFSGIGSRLEQLKIRD